MGPYGSGTERAYAGFAPYKTFCCFFSLKVAAFIAVCFSGLFIPFQALISARVRPQPRQTPLSS